ncbi:hypothetical protein ACEWY4_000381 [Coilia grayii]|uniref:Uncharacterized protein n=1 Tax=Coilia grayii TaxID=363190 RepID=A0ABD1KWI2_9TELE
MSSNMDLDEKNQRRSSDLKKMCPQQRARCQAYLEPSKEAQRSMSLAKQRVCATIAKEKSLQNDNTTGDMKKRQDSLIGQLKAAEARNRIRQMRLNYHNFRAESPLFLANLQAQEINVMISSQTTAQGALRVELLLPASESKMKTSDSLGKLQRRRVEEILDDERGLTLNRS